MAMKPKTTYIAAAFDTETTTLPDGRAFTCAYTLSMAETGPTFIYRTADEFIEALETLINRVPDGAGTPVIVAYNLAFDLASLWPLLAERWELETLKKTESDLYTVDLYSPSFSKYDAPPVLRFWDARHVEPRGLAYVGQLVGLPKLEGDWDYNAMRSHETPLTEKERDYAARDAEILLKFCEWIPRTYPWIKSGDLGRVLLTSASILRLFQRREVGKMRTGEGGNIGQRWRKLTSYNRALEFSQQQEQRRRAYAGGFTFCNPSTTWRTYPEVYHFDIESAYHFALTSLPVPKNWHTVKHYEKMGDKLGQRCAELRELAHTRTLPEWAEDLLNPFGYRFHITIELEGLTLTPASPLDVQDIGFLSARRVNGELSDWKNGGARSGLGLGLGLVNEYGRITAAERVTVSCDELELAALALAYEWAEMRIIKPPDESTADEWADFPRLSSLCLRAEKQRQKENGNPAGYAFFKRAYNSQAGVYAEQARSIEVSETETAEPFSLTYLPLASRVTSLTRLLLVLFIQTTRPARTPRHAAAKAGPGICVLSGDTDSLKLAGDERAIFAHVREFNELISELQRPPTALELAAAERRGWPIPAELGTLGMFQLERVAAEHREMAPKARAWLNTSGGIEVRIAGMKTGTLADVLTARQAEHGDGLAQLRPNTWLDGAIVTAVVREQADESDELQRFEGVDRDGVLFELDAYPAIALRDTLVCLASVANRETRQRLAQSKVDAPEGWLTARGEWEPF